MNRIGHIDKILEGICNMGIQTLQVYLIDNYSYQNTTKEVFLTQLEKLFAEHRDSGDTRLNVYTGRCAGKCCENCGKKGYRFVGDVSGNYLSLIIETSNENVVIDIYACNDFITDMAVDKLESEDWIFIHTDDQFNFKKTPEYWVKLNAAMAAYGEVITEPPTCLSFNDINYWLTKHAFTYNEIMNPVNAGMKWQCFTDLFWQLKSLRNYTNTYKSDFSKANGKYAEIKEEKELLTWMLDYEDMHRYVPYDFKYNTEMTDNGILLNKNSPLILTDTIFSDAFDFINNYGKHHMTLLNKYSTYSEEEICAAIGHQEYDFERNLAYSLKYHLEKRVEAAEMGIEIPFNLNGYSNGE